MNPPCEHRSRIDVEVTTRTTWQVRPDFEVANTDTPRLLGFDVRCYYCGETVHAVRIATLPPWAARAARLVTRGTTDD